MHLTMLLSSLPLPFEDAVRQAASLGFTHVDVVGLVERPESHREALADAGVHVACAALGKGLPDGHALDSVDVALRRAAVQVVKEQVADAARLGATHGYLVPGMDGSADGIARFGEACALLADHAAGYRVRLCVEHVPGRALPSAASVLTWLRQMDHANLALLLDVGHCLISGENAAGVVRSAGQGLGYVHFDDNDGVADRHWPLLTGRLTEGELRAVGEALTGIGYRGALCLELNQENAGPVEALRDGKEILQRYLPLTELSN